MRRARTPDHRGILPARIWYGFTGIECDGDGGIILSISNIFRTFVLTVILAGSVSLAGKSHGDTPKDYCTDLFHEIIYFKVNSESLSTVEKVLASAKVNQKIRDISEGKETYFCKIDKVLVASHVSAGFEKDIGFSEAQENGNYVLEILRKNGIADHKIEFENRVDADPVTDQLWNKERNHRVELLFVIEIGDEDQMIDMIAKQILDEYDANR